MKRLVAVACVAGLVVILGGASNALAQAAKPASENAARFEKLKSLAGTWKMVGTHGADEAVSGTFTYRVTAGGSAVVETLFVGHPHEMVTVYTLDGDDLVLTHYCAARNQPRMKAAAGGDSNTIKFEFVSLANGKPETDMHMHDGLITFVDDNHIKSEWQGWEAGQAAAGHKAMIELERVREAETK